MSDLPLDAAAPSEPPPPSRTLARSPLSDGEWHRLHPLTPLLRGGLALIVVIGIIVANLRDRLIALFLPGFAGDDAEEWAQWESSGDPIDWVIANDLYVVALLVVLAGVAAVVVGFWLSWRFHTLRITGDDVEVRSGILFRTQRRAPLDRVQGVNLTRPMVARLLGMAKLEVVGAGTDGNVKLEYLSTVNAEAVRADILRLASGRRLAESARASDAAGPAPAAGSRAAALGSTLTRGVTGLIEGEDAADDVPESVVHIPTGRLVMSQILTPGTFGLLFAIAAIVVGVSLGVTWLLLGFIPAVLGFGAYWVRMIVRTLRYSIAPTPDGVRITFGLLTTVTEIVPPGRIHALEVGQSILWRKLGWWTIRINRLSGRSLSDATTDQFTTVLPVGTIGDVERVLHLLLPHITPDDWRAIVAQGVVGGTGDDGYTTTPRRARIIRPLSWRRNGFRLTSDLLLLRRGVVWRRLAVLPLARLQSIALHQGPVDRMLGVASARGHVVTGPVYGGLGAIDRAAALSLLDEVAASAVRASSIDRSHRWADVGSTAADAAPAVDAAPGPHAVPTVDSAATTGREGQR